MSRLLLVAVVGDNSTDTEDDARWTLGPRAPMATDGWVASVQAAQAAVPLSRQGKGAEDQRQ